MDYNNSFKNRVNNYNYAITRYPNVLENEFKIAVDMCDIKDTDIVLNIPAACVPLHEYFKIKPKKYIEYEINHSFSKLMDVSHCNLESIPEQNDSIDTIITLASLHHTTEIERNEFYKECYRILRNCSGKLVIGDVIKNSKEANWLNIFVNKYNSNGHNGLFWCNNDKYLLELNGYDVKIEIKKYPWIFNGEEDLIDFCRNLFGLDLATNVEILNGINTYLCPVKKDNIIMIEWSLMYFISTKLLK